MKLAFEYLDEQKGIVKLTKPFEYKTIVVPEGFHSDLDSIPRWPVIFWLFGRRSPSASVVHDYLYRKTETTKAEADKIYHEILKITEPKIIAWLMYQGVKHFSWVMSKRK